MSGLQAGPQRTKLHATLHELSQPLTVVSLALTLAQASTSDAERMLALEAAVAECQRAMNSVRQLRSMLDEEVPSKRPVIGVKTWAGTEAQWEFGGAA
ncbi:hypothetical protein [Terriglobus sp.]|uniref:hypothetical protein n=1 Tax=Terriglobus sp. TaxID=1889013 RepID=UPI003B005DB1